MSSAMSPATDLSKIPLLFVGANVVELDNRVDGGAVEGATSLPRISNSAGVDETCSEGTC